MSFLIIGLTGCDSNRIWPWDSVETKKNKQANIKKEKKKNQEWIEKLVDVTSDFSSSEKIALLSYKYSIEEDLLIKILKKYEERANQIDAENFNKLFQELDKNLEDSSAKKENEYKKILLTISNDFGISKDILASLIIDYKLLVESEE